MLSVWQSFPSLIEIIYIYHIQWLEREKRVWGDGWTFEWIAFAFTTNYIQIILLEIPLIFHSVNSFSCYIVLLLPTPRPAIKHSLSESKNGEHSMQQTNNNFDVFFFIRRIYWYCYLFAAITARCLHVSSARNTSFWLRIHWIWFFFLHVTLNKNKMHFGCLFVCVCIIILFSFRSFIQCVLLLVVVHLKKSPLLCHFDSERIYKISSVWFGSAQRHCLRLSRNCKGHASRVQGQSSANIKRCGIAHRCRLMSHRQPPIFGLPHPSLSLLKSEHGGWCLAVYSCHSNMPFFVLYFGCCCCVSSLIAHTGSWIKPYRLQCMYIFIQTTRWMCVCVSVYTRNRYHITIKHVRVSLYYGADCVSVCGLCTVFLTTQTARRMHSDCDSHTHTYSQHMCH